MITFKIHILWGEIYNMRCSAVNFKVLLTFCLRTPFP